MTHLKIRIVRLLELVPEDCLQAFNDYYVLRFQQRLAGITHVSDDEAEANDTHDDAAATTTASSSTTTTTTISAASSCLASKVKTPRGVRREVWHLYPCDLYVESHIAHHHHHHRLVLAEYVNHTTANTIATQ
jgi:hypothetical protein